MDVIKATKRLIAFTPEISCDQTAMGLPPVTSGRLGEISKMPLLPLDSLSSLISIASLRGLSGSDMYVCM
jgi:hypothetical protein